ncbi:MAG: peptide chain release factor N(5)-glutamine methyltransferase [Candidatus Marinimicrobia bacterium]|nr:peptide chain release factor N(5)-glutamine methyltransferase [Candidatus Neomarinimicrobiota bacterium]MDP7120690.1 peptide chain release factor N(5)-glutamine methyltransferase [Candidatus Neomarinimicrobiota bacterium]MDP7484110.1 peptide chain release factor N(5)-glutamine methyltransferase [Candidatus Neomarinimicrobiota bacterium]MDP7527996.1 peptide chain release factor N(5)-glutamine methyltransferase [Candidatus Neomarinimicrobiota bacterium]MDP7715392.1 peptide chain release factor
MTNLPLPATVQENSTVQRVLEESVRLLTDARTDAPKAQAEWLLLSLLKLSRSQLHLEADHRCLTHQQKKIFKDWLRRSAAGEPVQYITGETEFFGLPFTLTGDVLIPRPETERLVEIAINEANESKEFSILDIGTGCGSIAVSLACSLKEISVTATDNNRNALKVAQLNAKKNGVASRIQFIDHDILNDEVENCFDIIISNPPYVPLNEYKALQDNVRCFEPREALTEDADGLTFYRSFAAKGKKWLREGGMMILEVGCGKHPLHAKELFESAGWTKVELFKDYNGDLRVLKAKRS